MEYYNPTNPPKIEPQSDFSMFASEYEEIIDPKTGEKKLKETKTNIYEKIQAHKDACLLQNIISKYEIDYDTLKNAVEIDENEIADYTKLPTTLIEAYAITDKAEKQWNKLPAKIKMEFDNRFEKFLESATNGKLENVIKKYTKTTQKQKVEENNENVEQNVQNDTINVQNENQIKNTGVNYE